MQLLHMRQGFNVLCLETLEGAEHEMNEDIEAQAQEKFHDQLAATTQTYTDTRNLLFNVIYSD